MTTAISILFFACANSMEQEAKHLAVLQKERVEIIKLMLRVDDSLQVSVYRQKLMEITTVHKIYKNQIEMKYKSEDERVRFEMKYRKALE
jgi:uncharacterized protein YsxB (DUF464 family)